MPQKIRMWEVTPKNTLSEISSNAINLEEQLENWLESDISMLDPDLLVIGRQVRTDFGGEIDLLCMDARGDLVTVELKKGRTPREVTAQALDYASWVKDLSFDEITNIAERYPKLGGELATAFEARFGDRLPETLNQKHRSLIVAEAMDESTERIVRYLTDLNVPINVATVQHFTTADGKSVLAQVFLVEPAEIATKRQSPSKRQNNLTQGEFQQLANETGVGDLYAHLGEKARGIMERGPMGSRVIYKVPLDDRIVTAVIVRPEDSDAINGLRFSLSSNRLMRYFSLSQEQLADILPPSSEEITGAPPWGGATAEERKSWREFSGFFRTPEEVDMFIDGLTGQDLRVPSNG